MAERMIGQKAGVLAMLLVLSGCAGAPHRELADMSALRRQAMSAYKQGDFVRALTDYRALAEQLPADTGVWFRLGNVYAHLNQPQQAAEAYRHVLQRDPGHAKAWHNLGVMYLHQAEAAFVQSAHTAGRDAALREQGLAMAARLNTVARAPGSGDHMPLPGDDEALPPAAGAAAATAPRDASSAPAVVRKQGTGQ